MTRSMQPWQIQALVGFGGVLLGALMTGVGWKIGLHNAYRVQDRQRQVRKRAIAKALLAEVRRLLDEVGARPQDSLDVTLFGNRPAVPSVSRWVESVLVEAADADPVIVEEFMRVERELHNLGIQHDALNTVRDDIASRESMIRDLERRQEMADAQGFGETWNKLATDKTREQNRLDEARETKESLTSMRDNLHKRAAETLTRLDVLLTRTAERDIQPQGVSRHRWRKRDTDSR